MFVDVGGVKGWMVVEVSGGEVGGRRRGCWGGVGGLRRR